jgi:hypothetical protein
MKKKPHSFRRGLFTILVAAVVGATLFDGMIIADNWAYTPGELGGFGWLLSIPSMWLTDAIGMKGPPFLDPYLVNGALGALLFALLAGYWLAIRRGMRSTKTETHGMD